MEITISVGFGVVILGLYIYTHIGIMENRMEVTI